MNSLDSTIPLLRLFWKASWIALIQKFHRPGYLSLGKDLPGRSAEKTDEEDLPGRSAGKNRREKPPKKIPREHPLGSSPGKEIMPRKKSPGKGRKTPGKERSCALSTYHSRLVRQPLVLLPYSFRISSSSTGRTAHSAVAQPVQRSRRHVQRSHSPYRGRAGTYSGRTARTAVAPARTAVAQPVQRSRRPVQRSCCPYSGYAARPTVAQPIQRPRSLSKGRPARLQVTLSGSAASDT